MDINSIAQFIADISEKYGIDEQPNDMLKKMSKEEPLNSETLLLLTKDLLDKNVNPEDFPALLQSKLNVSSETSKKISDEIIMFISGEQQKPKTPNFKKPVLRNKIKLPEEKIPEFRPQPPIQKRTGPDSYREQIE